VKLKTRLKRLKKIFSVRAEIAENRWFSTSFRSRILLEIRPPIVLR
jgi:hypothetical protein